MLTKAIIDLASEYGRYGYRRVTALLKQSEWHVNHKRVTDLATRRLKGATKATETESVMVERWLVYSFTFNASKPCLVL